MCVFTQREAETERQDARTTKASLIDQHSALKLKYQGLLDRSVCMYLCVCVGGGSMMKYNTKIASMPCSQLCERCVCVFAVSVGVRDLWFKDLWFKDFGVRSTSV